MNGSERYAIDETRIVSEIIDGEAIIINLANGYYYSLDPTATEVWGWIEKGRSVSEIVSALQFRYDCSQADPEPAVRGLLAALGVDDLIVPRPVSDNPPAHEPLTDSGVSHRRLPFSAPTFQRFTDMQGFLLVDPIHEVDERGWPNVKSDGSASPSGG